MDARAEQDASCEVVEPQQQLGEMSDISPGRRVSVVEDAAKDEVASQSASLSHGMEVKKKRLEILRRKFEVEKAPKELELQLCELELEEEISDHHSRISEYAEKTEIWMRETDHVGATATAYRDGGDRLSCSTPTPVGIGPTTVGATRVATAAAVASQRSDGAMAKADRGHQPSTPTSASVPPDYDRTMAVEQAAAMEREYAQWRRAVEDSIKVHRTKYFGQSCRAGAVAMAAPCSANSTVKQLPSIQSAFVDASLTPSQKAARENTPKELPIFSGTVEQWPLFITAYDRSTAACGFTDEENLIRLQRALKGPALESVDHLLLLPDGLADVLDILRSEYGRPDLIVDSLVEKVRRLPPVRSERLESLAIFGKAVRKMCATIKASGLKEYDCNVTLLKELVAKLPAERRLEWARHKVKLPRKSVVEFGKWFTEIAVAASTEVNPFERNLHVEQSRSQPARKPPKQPSLECSRHQDM